MNVLFDLDGTLTDSRPGIIACIRHALERCGVTSPSDSRLQACIGPPLRHSFAELLGAHLADPCVATAVATYRERFSSIGMFENTVYEHIPMVMDELSRRGARLFVATSKPQVFAERILEHFRLAHRFSAIFGSGLDGTREDKAELIAHAVGAAALEPSETIMIGDREHDMRGAIINGIYGAGVLWGYGSEEELRAAGARTLLGAPTDIPHMFDSLCDETRD